MAAETLSAALHCASVLLPQGWAQDTRLTLDEAGVIVAIEAAAPAPGDLRLRGPVVPGMPNLHSHGFQRLIAGLTARAGDGRDSFWSWREAMYRMALRLEPEGLEHCMAGVFLEMLRAGYTSCAEFHYLHHAPDGAPYANPAELSERVFAAAATTGMALTHLPVWYQRSGFDATSARPEQRRFVNDLDAYLDLVQRCETLARGLPNSRVGLAPHSLRAVPTGCLPELADQAGKERPVHIHIAEQPKEVTDCLAFLGARPLQWLLDQVGTGPQWCLVHATHIDADECRHAAATGAVAGLCPTTEADLGDGIFPAEAWIEADGRFGVGSDSNLRICPAEELRSLEMSQRLVSGRRNVLASPGRSTGGELHARAARGGAQATGQPVGAIAPGARGDLVELDPGHPLLQGLAPAAALDTWVFAGDRDMVRSVRVGGRLLVDGGHHPRETAIERSYRAVLEALRRQ